MQLKESTFYKGQKCVMATQHAKEQVVCAVFETKLGLEVIKADVDTDQLGTFTGEIERKMSAIESARVKCELGVRWARDRGLQAPFALASEGSFGRHPEIPWLASAEEILYFVDSVNGFYLYEKQTSLETNFKAQTVSHYDELASFAEMALFPSHGLVVKVKNYTIKGVTNYDALAQAFQEAKKRSSNGQIVIETDMRAHMNPTRMQQIGNLAASLAERLMTFCPQCDTPGWGKVGVEYGLACESCSIETDCIKATIFGCPKCSHKVKSVSEQKADPQYCVYCNP